MAGLINQVWTRSGTELSFVCSTLLDATLEACQLIAAVDTDE